VKVTLPEIPAFGDRVFCGCPDHIIPVHCLECGDAMADFPDLPCTTCCKCFVYRAPAYRPWLCTCKESDPAHIAANRHTTRDPRFNSHVQRGQRIGEDHRDYQQRLKRERALASGRGGGK
jgi:hypothetical protein